MTDLNKLAHYQELAIELIHSTEDEVRKDAAHQLFDEVIDEQGRFKWDFVQRYAIYYCEAKRASDFGTPYNLESADLIAKMSQCYLSDHDITDMELAQDVIEAMQMNFTKSMPSTFSAEDHVGVHLDICKLLGVEENYYEINYKQFQIRRKGGTLDDMLEKVIQDIDKENKNNNHKNYKFGFFSVDEHQPLSLHDYLRQRVSGWDEKVEKHHLDKAMTTTEKQGKRMKL